MNVTNAEIINQKQKIESEITIYNKNIKQFCLNALKEFNIDKTVYMMNKFTNVVYDGKIVICDNGNFFVPYYFGFESYKQGEHGSIFSEYWWMTEKDVENINEFIKSVIIPQLINGGTS